MVICVRIVWVWCVLCGSTASSAKAIVLSYSPCIIEAIVCVYDMCMACENQGAFDRRHEAVDRCSGR